MKRWLAISLLINVVLLAVGFFALRKLGGWRFFVHRLQHSEAPLYQHRRQLFDCLPKQPGAIIFLGDSQTALCEWRELFGDTLPILNRGIVADQVEGLRSRLNEVIRQQPTKIFLLVGINDLLFGKSVEEMEIHYREIIREIRTTSPATQIVLQSLLPVNNHVKNTGIANMQIQAFNTRIEAIAKDYALAWVNVHPMLADAAGNLASQYTEDGLHLNGAGYLVWKHALEPFLTH